MERIMRRIMGEVTEQSGFGLLEILTATLGKTGKQ
jgi:hypothetical protein